MLLVLLEGDLLRHSAAQGRCFDTKLLVFNVGMPSDWKSRTFSSWCYPAKSMSFLPLVGTHSHISSQTPSPGLEEFILGNKPWSLFRPSATPLAWPTYRKERAWDSLEDPCGLLTAFKWQHKAPYMLERLLQSIWKVTWGAWTKQGRKRNEERKADDGSAAGI